MNKEIENCRNGDLVVGISEIGMLVGAKNPGFNAEKEFIDYISKYISDWNLVRYRLLHQNTVNTVNNSVKCLNEFSFVDEEEESIDDKTFTLIKKFVKTVVEEKYSDLSCSEVGSREFNRDNGYEIEDKILKQLFCYGLDKGEKESDIQFGLRKKKWENQDPKKKIFRTKRTVEIEGEYFDYFLAGKIDGYGTTVSIDGVEDVLYEIKTRKGSPNENVKDHNMCQVQMYMHFKGMRRAVVVEASQSEKGNLNRFNVTYDPKLVEVILNRLDSFVRKLVVYDKDRSNWIKAFKSNSIQKVMDSLITPELIVPKDIQQKVINQAIIRMS